MAEKRGIRLNISNQRVEALAEICEEMIEEFNPVNGHQRLLREYLLEFRYKLRQMLKRRQNTYMLRLIGSEAIAFDQLWNMLDVKYDKYANLIVDSLLKKMSCMAA